MENRIYYIDNFKSFIIFLVIVLHSSIIYMKDVPEWWYVIDPSKNSLFSIIVLMLNTFLMPAMFYASGIFTVSSIQKHSKYLFMLNKFKRLIIPWLIGIIFLAPIQIYFYCITRNIKIDSLWQISFFFNGYQHCHYWFLSLLFFFFFISVIFFDYLRKIADKTCNNPELYFIISNIIIYFLMNFLFDSEMWINFKILLFQPVKVIIYFNYFLIGMFYKDSIHIKDLNINTVFKKIGIILLFSIVYIAAKSSQTQTNILLKMMSEAISFNILVITIITLLLKIFREYFNNNNKLLKYFSKNSYGVYYIHQYFVLGTGIILISTNINIFFKWTILIIISFILSNFLTNIFNKIINK